VANYPPWDVVKGAVGDALRDIRREIEADYSRKFQVLEARLAVLEAQVSGERALRDLHERTAKMLDERQVALDRLEQKLDRIIEPAQHPRLITVGSRRPQ
jgi:uncharacterized coiled-coil protein SlyX